MLQPIRWISKLCLVWLLALAMVGQAVAAEHDHEQAGTATVWTCSMHPQIQLPEFGQCPICFMDLIEVAMDDSGAERRSLRQISFDERARKLARVEVVPVVRGVAGGETRMVGKVEYDETRVGTITAWVGGRIDILHVDYTGSRVRKGQAMAEIYSPELLTAQAELIQAVRAVAAHQESGSAILQNTVRRTEQAARDKLRLLGLTREQIAAVVSGNEPLRHITLLAPMAGIVITKNVAQGIYVQTGAPLYTIADLDHLWVVLEAYESDLQGVSLGQQVTFQAEAIPGRSFQGKVVYVDPTVAAATRTIRVRLNVNNKDGLLKPGMFVRAQASQGAPEGDRPLPLLIPASAPLITGKRALVYVQDPDQEGVYVGKEVILGPRRGQHYEVVSGLTEGELVVSSGNFKIDSAIQLQARPSMMNPLPSAAGQGKAPLPALFLSKLRGLPTLFARLTEQARRHDEAALDPLLTAFAKRLQDLAEVQPAGDDGLIWQELAMLLGGDVILLGEAAGPAERQRLLAAMDDHFQGVSRRYQLDDGWGGSGSPEMRLALGRVVRSYLELQKALAADDPAAARQAAVAVTGALAITTPLLEEGLAGQLGAAGAALVAARELEAIRTAFYPLSQVLSRAVTEVGVAGSGPLFEQYCPMAFGNSGATWLAGDEEINNPYFGAMMLRCGEVRRQLHDEV